MSNIGGIRLKFEMSLKEENKELKKKLEIYEKNAGFILCSKCGVLVSTMKGTRLRVVLDTPVKPVGIKQRTVGSLCNKCWKEISS